ncbi:2-phospho-L-lactate transferase CofD family protein, partial [Erysipelothrix rhusiopathiae]|nr:2-phospho-L-lactate transferase CofD family protein [Erysipelothrix rhusiopathiae]
MGGYVDYICNVADVILLGVGSLYTTILTNIIISEIKAALQNSTGKIIYYCNAM